MKIKSRPNILNNLIFYNISYHLIPPRNLIFLIFQIFYHLKSPNILWSWKHKWFNTNYVIAIPNYVTLIHIIRNWKIKQNMLVMFLSFFYYDYQTSIFYILFYYFFFILFYSIYFRNTFFAFVYYMPLITYWLLFYFAILIMLFSV